MKKFLYIFFGILAILPVDTSVEVLYKCDKVFKVHIYSLSCKILPIASVMTHGH